METYLQFFFLFISRIGYDLLYTTFTKSILICIALEQMDRFQTENIFAVKINSIDDKNALVDIESAVDEIISTHSVGHVYQGCFSRRMYK